MPNNPSNTSAAYLRSRVGRVCVAIHATTVAELLERAEAALAESSFLEFRLDALEKMEKHATAVGHVAQIGKFLAAHSQIVAIATCRRKAFGGGFSGTLHEELEILHRASEAGFSLLDVEIESAEECETQLFDNLREAWLEAGAALMISFHDYEKAGDPDSVFARIQNFAPDFVKIVSSARCLSDSLHMLRWIEERSGEAQLVGIAMGEAGIVSRILSLRAGSAFTFAASPVGDPTAPGQMTARTLKELYRIEDLDQATRIYGVAGNPIAHSLSPLMQNTAFRRERINAIYLPLKSEKVEDLLSLIRGLPLSGLSVTMPLKLQLLPFLTNVDPLTAKLGACNTIRMGALEKRLPLKGARVLVLGAGGAARAAVFGLVEKGAEVSVWSRNEHSANDLAAAARAKSVSRKVIAASAFDVMINATPCGMHGSAHEMPLEPEEWKARLVFDLVYNPLDTPLLQLARKRGFATIQGVEMFVQQGARQFELWTGKAAPEAEMLRVVLFALNKAQHP